MEIKSKVSTKGERKIIEIPKSVRDNFAIGDDVIIRRIIKCPQEKCNGELIDDIYEESRVKYPIKRCNKCGWWG